eukprot:CAMPEP_0115887640 /NCGR_PEP_ID=MMETSP0287-20121206/31866_1 /TAXON_ID=412157 /ORGANISM="Chrysochromulina rotalis, Strain UIO044" /LENGTH=65 /DNA_ID=CAMNT_0003344239 /DNA_START=91 /DNA_END=285 /DNA_ORIENTATION=-
MPSSSTRGSIVAVTVKLVVVTERSCDAGDGRMPIIKWESALSYMPPGDVSLKPNDAVTRSKSSYS